MTLAEVETFLSIVHTKSITKTSELLFLSQPAISHRLRSLEEELGFSLLVRSKGHKMVELTPKGEAFVPIAERWSSLWKETIALREQEDRLLLTIGCTDSLSLAIMAPLYQQLLSSDARIDLSIQTHHSAALYRLLSDHDIDLGFVYHQLHYSSIITERLFEEPLFLVQTDTPAVPKPRIHTDELNPYRELFLSWDDNYQIWHEKWFTGAHRAHIQADAIGILELLWNRPDNWIIAPESVVIMLARRRPVYVSRLVNEPPRRVCYRILHRYPKLSTQKAAQIFEKALTDYLEARSVSIPFGVVWRLSES